MRTIPVLRNDFESLDRLLVPDNIIQFLRSVLFYPIRVERPRKIDGALTCTHHGNSYALFLLAGAFPFAMDEVICKGRVVSVTCNPDAQHLTRLAETAAISSDHIAEGPPIIFFTAAESVHEMLFYGQGAAFDIPTQATS